LIGREVRVLASDGGTAAAAPTDGHTELGHVRANVRRGVGGGRLLVPEKLQRATTVALSGRRDIHVVGIGGRRSVMKVTEPPLALLATPLFTRGLALVLGERTCTPLAFAL